ncbi:MAG: 50S ribosomal protein L18 [Ignavibacteriae bacterium]|nr:50S ribosomal protein L18 [Ignavibacteriota bacterium]
MKNNRIKKKIKIRKKISGTTERPRISVFKSLNQVYAQIIDDTNGTTLVSESTLSKSLASDLKKSTGKIEKSKIVGNSLAKKAIEKGITNIVFDRSGYKYHGRIQAIAEGAREGGLKF